MLSKSRSTRTALLKYGLSAPLFVVMLVFSSASVKSAKIKNYADQLSLAKSDQFPVFIKSQTDTLKIKGNVFTMAEVMPEFPGGMKPFYEYLGKNLQFSAEARKNNVTGKVILQFIVETDGKLNEIKVLRGLGSGLDEEAVRVLSASPNWKPGLQNGKPVRVQYTLPIAFNIAQTGSLQKSGSLVDSSLTIQGATPLYIVDGIEMPSANLKSKIQPDLIKSINVIKGEKAITKYGEKGKYGVVEIYVNSLPENATGTSIRSVPAGSIAAKQAVSVSVLSKSSSNALYVINNKRYNVKAGTDLLKEISPDDIESINVLKGEKEISVYGEDGKNGVIIVTLKKK